MAFFLFLTALVQGAENDAVLAIRVEGCGKGLYEQKSDILSILQDVSGETNLTWEHGVCKGAGAKHHEHHHKHHHAHSEEIRGFCANTTNATNAANATADKPEGCPRCERCAEYCLEDCEGEVAECLASDGFVTCHEECLAKNTSLAKNVSGKSMTRKFGKKQEGGKPMGGKFGEKPDGEKREGGKFGEKPDGEKREGGKPMGGKFGEKSEGEKREGGKFGEKHGKKHGEKREGGKPVLAFAAPEAAAARLETPEALEELQARVCELLSAANKTKNATEPCVVALEHPQCDADGFPMIAVSGIAGGAVILIAFVAGCRSISRRRSARVVKQGVVMMQNDLETGAAQAESKTRESDLVSEASTAFTARPTTATTVAGGVGAPTVARTELRMA